LNALSELHRALQTSPRDHYRNDASHGVRIVETDAAWVLQTDLPGFSKKDVSLSFQKGTLRLVGERDNPTDAFPSKFERSFQVAKELDVAHVSASLENGLLEITIPKPTVETNGPIEIKVN
jgi:HSP20 family molecular chaperone IbpA